MALPEDSGVRSLTTMREKRGAPAKGLPEPARLPMTLVSMPVPLTFFPISSTSSRSPRSKGTRASQDLATFSSRFSTSNSSPEVMASMTPV